MIALSVIFFTPQQMPVLLCSTEGPEHARAIEDVVISHVQVAKQMLADIGADDEVRVPVLHAAAEQIDFICDFLSRNKDLPVPADGDVQRSGPRRLSVEDREQLVAFETKHGGLAISQLFKASLFCDSQLLLNTVATFLGEVITSRDQAGVVEYFGVPYNPTKQQMDEVDARYPEAFY